MNAALRRAVSVMVATAGDAVEQQTWLGFFGSADALRGGTYVANQDESAQLVRAKVVTDASVSGSVGLQGDGFVVAGTVSGHGVGHGTLSVTVSKSGAGRATGVYAGRKVDVRFLAS